MLALYHMAGGTPVEDLPGLDQLLSQERADRAGEDQPRGAGGHVARPAGRHQRWKAVGRSARPGANWRGSLGGAEAFDMIAENDASGIAPGSNLLEALFKKCAPSPDPDRRMGRLSAPDLQGRGAAVRLVRRQPVLRSVADRGGQGEPGHAAGGIAARVADRGRRRRWSGGAGAPEADLQPRRNRHGVLHRRKKATRSSVAGCSRKFPATSSITATTR